MSFEDALVKLRGLDAYERNVQMIRRLFSVKLVTHAISVTGSTEITTRCLSILPTSRAYLLAVTPQLTFLHTNSQLFL